MVIFLFLGISLYDVDLHDFASLDYALIAWTVFFAIIFRPLGVIVLTLLVNLFRFRKINIKQTFIMVRCAMNISFGVHFWEMKLFI
jgi:NhaP-type Na+/H+ or K+/H+ antiporter